MSNDAKQEVNQWLAAVRAMSSEEVEAKVREIESQGEHYFLLRILRMLADVHSADNDILGAYAHAALSLLPDVARFSDEEDDVIMKVFLEK